MGSNYENSNLYPDWSDQNLNDDLPLDLQDCELRNPSLSNFQSGLIAGTLFAGVEQSWVNDPYVGSNHQGNNLALNDEVEYSRTASNSPGTRQYRDLQIDNFGEQLGFSVSIHARIIELIIVCVVGNKVWIFFVKFNWPCIIFELSYITFEHTQKDH